MAPTLFSDALTSHLFRFGCFDGPETVPSLRNHRLGEGKPPSAVDAVGKVDGRAEVARPEGVAAAPVVRPTVFNLSCGMHREFARSGEPAFISCAREQGQECMAVPRCAVAEVCTLS